MMTTTSTAPVRSGLSEDLFHQQLRECYWQFASYEQSLQNISIIFNRQSSVLPLQCDETIKQISFLRDRSILMRSALVTLEPDYVQALKPYGSIEKLDDLALQTFEILLYVDMFRDICQMICTERVQYHLHIAYLLRQCLRSFKDTLAQLTELANRERIMVMVEVPA